MKAGRVIDGEVYDATLEARRIVDEAHDEAERVRAEARAEGERVKAQVIAEAAAARDAAGARGDGAGAGEGQVDEVVGLVVRATIAGGAPGELVRSDR